METYELVIFYHIYEFLPTKDLLACSETCKDLYKLFKSEWRKRLATAHYQFYKLCSIGDDIVYYLINNDNKQRYSISYALYCMNKKNKGLLKFLIKKYKEREPDKDVPIILRLTL